MLMMMERCKMGGWWSMMMMMLMMMMRCKMGGWWSNSMPVALTMDSFKCSHGVTFLDYIPCLYLIGESLSSSAFWLIAPQGALAAIGGHSSIVTTLEFIIIMLIVIVSNSCRKAQGRYIWYIREEHWGWFWEILWDGFERCHEEKLTTVWTSGNSKCRNSLSHQSQSCSLKNLKKMTMIARMVVCCVCVRLFGCLHSWADGRGRRSDNTRQSHYFTGLTGNKCSQQC